MGWNADGQLGDGGTDDRSRPVKVVGLAGHVVKQLSTKADFTLALTGQFFPRSTEMVNEIHLHFIPFVFSRSIS